MPETKVCYSCKRSLPATTEYFSKHSKERDGLRGQCKECKAKEAKRYRAEHREQRLAYNKQYKTNHPGFIRMVKRRRYQKCREVISEQGKRYYQKNREIILAKTKEYRQENPEMIRLQSHRREARKRDLPHTLTVKQWREIKSIFNNSCAYCGEKKPLTQDHFFPLSKGGEYTRNNIIPACKTCNSSKNANEPFSWYSKQPFYSKLRERKIMNHLNYDENHEQQLAIF